ncbi:hypothetical protein TcasGA2_TC008330 [Tribolium castaneum]|uniref:Uncharacterized protein n=1 Tax=Tribolium castaneum TaxID=7070 RepID=D2A149_TRICA|nr:hypothetical protein TcasGA2_TC008330 [Tribolium castaneum]
MREFLRINFTISRIVEETEEQSGELEYGALHEKTVRGNCAVVISRRSRAHFYIIILHFPALNAPANASDETNLPKLSALGKPAHDGSRHSTRRVDHERGQRPAIIHMVSTRQQDIARRYFSPKDRQRLSSVRCRRIWTAVRAGARVETSDTADTTKTRTYHGSTGSGFAGRHLDTGANRGETGLHSPQHRLIC